MPGRDETLETWELGVPATWESYSSQTREALVHLFIHRATLETCYATEETCYPTLSQADLLFHAFTLEHFPSTQVTVLGNVCHSCTDPAVQG